jgi:hypothetical protein
MAKKKYGKYDTKAVMKLARDLADWAEHLTEPERILVRWLLCRGAYKEIQDAKGGIHCQATFVYRRDIEKAALDALAPLLKGGFPNPDEGWPRVQTHPIPWPRNGEPGWPRDGNWALDMGTPPQAPK